MSNSTTATTTIPSSTTLLGILFVGLKLTGHINWPWIWVLSPFWIPLVVAMVLLFIVGILYAIANSSK